MKKLAAFSLCLVLAGHLSPGPAFAKTMDPSGARLPANATYRDIDDLGDSAYTSLASALHLTCIDADIRDGVVAQAQESRRLIRQWAQSHGSAAERRKADLWVKALDDDIWALLLKPPCGAAASPQPAGTVPAAPGGSGSSNPPTPSTTPPAPAADAGQCPTAADEERIGVLEGELKQIQFDAQDLANKISAAREQIASDKASIKYDEAIIKDPSKKTAGADDDLDPYQDKADREHDIRTLNEQIEQWERQINYIVQDAESKAAELNALKAKKPCPPAETPGQGQKPAAGSTGQSSCPSGTNGGLLAGALSGIFDSDLQPVCEGPQHRRDTDRNTDSDRDRGQRRRD